MVDFKVKNISEFQHMIDNNDVRIPKSIIASITDNINNIKQNITTLSITCQEPIKITYNVNLERKHFQDTLQENLKFFIENECYEECNEVVALVDTLKNKKTITNIIQSLNEQNKQ